MLLVSGSEEEILKLIPVAEQHAPERQRFPALWACQRAGACERLLAFGPSRLLISSVGLWLLLAKRSPGLLNVPVHKAPPMSSQYRRQSISDLSSRPKYPWT